jgi:hypothetical protein
LHFMNLKANTRCLTSANTQSQEREKERANV